MTRAREGPTDLAAANELPPHRGSASINMARSTVCVVRRVVERFPYRVVWGTDWPHPNMETNTPYDGALVDVVPRIATTAALRRALLVDNPGRLYWAAAASNDVI